MDDTTDRSPRPRGHWLLKLGAALLVLLVVIGFIGYRLWVSPPDFWTAAAEKLDAMSADARQRVAESLRNSVMEQWSLPGPYADSRDYQDAINRGEKTADLIGDTRTLTIPLEDANAFLVHNLDDRLNAKGIGIPEAVQRVLIHTDNNRPILAIHIKNQDVDQVFSFELETDFDTPDSPIIQVRNVTAGRLPLPLGQVRQQVLDLEEVKDEPKAKDIVNRIFDGEPLSRIVLPLDGDHAGQIIGFEIDDQSIRITRRIIRDTDD